MIHLHSMFSSGTNASTVGHTSAGHTSKAPLTQATLDGFQSALSDAVSSTLEKFGIDPSDVKISITPSAAAPTAPASTTGNPVRTTPPPPTISSTPSTSSSSTSSSSNNTPSSTSTTSGPPNGGYDPFLQAAYNNPFKTTAAGSAVDTASKSVAIPVDPQVAFDNAYWAKQPAAVQALRTIQDPEQRTAMATQLANEGYSIDVPIMVWGWDPSLTTSMRQADGYTWVPSALQKPVEVAPGLPSLGGNTAYDPNNPPAGSIAV
jgi:hypothetical protein